MKRFGLKCAMARTPTQTPRFCSRTIEDGREWNRSTVGAIFCVSNENEYYDPHWPVGGGVYEPQTWTVGQRRGKKFSELDRQSKTEGIKDPKHAARKRWSCGGGMGTQGPSGQAIWQSSSAIPPTGVRAEAQAPVGFLRLRQRGL